MLKACPTDLVGDQISTLRIVRVSHVQLSALSIVSYESKFKRCYLIIKIYSAMSNFTMFNKSESSQSLKKFRRMRCALRCDLYVATRQQCHEHVLVEGFTMPEQFVISALLTVSGHTNAIFAMDWTYGANRANCQLLESKCGVT